MIIRPEQTGDEARIRQLIEEAFAEAPHNSGTEAAIVDALRAASALTISLVAVKGENIIGHVAVSPVTIVGTPGWFGLGPVAVQPQQQRKGIGTALIGEALSRLRSLGTAGCVVLGEPSYYARFGFAHHRGLTYGNVPPGYFQALCFVGAQPSGAVEYHSAFSVAT